VLGKKLKKTAKEKIKETNAKNTQSLQKSEKERKYKEDIRKPKEIGSGKSPLEGGEEEEEGK
jgi:hypothetical protein